MFSFSFWTWILLLGIQLQEISHAIYKVWSDTSQQLSLHALYRFQSCIKVTGSWNASPHLSVAPLSSSSADITASRVPGSVSCDMSKKFLWRDLKTGQLSFSSCSSVAQYICRTIEDQRFSIILAAFFLHFHQTF